MMTLLAQYAQVCSYWGRPEIWHYAKPILHSGLAGLGFGAVFVVHRTAVWYFGPERRRGGDRRTP